MNCEVFIPLKIKTHKGRAAVVLKPNDHFANTPLSRLLAKAYILEGRLIQSAQKGFTLKQFCEVNKISQRYVRSIVAVNALSPKIKRAIMEGNVPRSVGVERIRRCGMLLCWQEQEEWVFSWK